MKAGIKIKHATYEPDYKIKILFTDGKCNIFDYTPLVTSDHEEFSPFLNVSKFKKFQVVDGDFIAWGDEWKMMLEPETLYHKKSFTFRSPVDKNDPIAVLKYMMKLRNINSARLSEMISEDKGNVSSFLNYKRGLSKNVIRKLSDVFHMKQEYLNIPYKLKR